MVHVTKAELAAIVEAAMRVARRTGKQFVIRWDRVKVVD